MQDESNVARFGIGQQQRVGPAARGNDAADRTP